MPVVHCGINFIKNEKNYNILCDKNFYTMIAILMIPVIFFLIYLSLKINDIKKAEYYIQKESALLKSKKNELNKEKINVYNLDINNLEVLEMIKNNNSVIKAIERIVSFKYDDLNIKKINISKESSSIVGDYYSTNFFSQFLDKINNYGYKPSLTTLNCSNNKNNFCEFEIDINIY